MKRIISIIIVLSIILSVVPAMGASDGDVYTIEAEDLYTNGKTTVFNRTVSDSSASGSKWLCADSSYVAVGKELTLTFTVPEDMNAMRVAIRYKGKSSGRAKGTLSIGGKDYMSLSMVQSKETYYTSDNGPIVKVTPGEEITLTYTITTSGTVAVDCIYLTYASTLPESEDEVILNEDFSACDDNFGFPSNASVADGVLKLFETTAANYTLTTKNFDSSVSSLSAVDVTFDWTSHLYKKSGSKIGLEFRDSDGNIIFAIMNGTGGSQLRYSTTSATLSSDTVTAESTIPTPTTITYNTTDTTFAVHFTADFAEGTVSFEIMDKATGFIVAQGIEAETSAKNLSKMIGGNYYLGYSSSNLDDGTQDIDNFVVKGKTTQSYILNVRYTLNGEVIEETDFGVVYPDNTVTIGSTDAYYVAGLLVNNSEEYSSYAVQGADASDGVITKTIPVEVVQKYVVSADSFVNNGTANDSGDKGNRILIAAGGAAIDNVSQAPHTDADNIATMEMCAYFGSARAGILEFPIDAEMNNNAVIMNVFVNVFKSNGGSAGGRLRLAAYPVGNFEDADNLTITYDDTSLINNENPIFSIDTLVSTSNETTLNEYARFDVTEAVHTALSSGKDKITFKILTPNAGVYLADKEQTHLTGNFPGKAAYLEICEANTVTVTGSDKITKNGSLIDSVSVIVPEESRIKLYSEAAVAFTDGVNVYKANEFVTPDETTDLSAVSLGVNVVSGAQVRFGDGVDEEGKVKEGNGLRFIGIVDRADSLTSVDGAEYGLKITAEGNEGAAFVKAEKWQSEEDGVFSVALTNLAESNYNRNYTATPYVKVDGQEFLAETSVTRSIYKVSAGLLKNGVTLDDNGEEENDGYTTENGTLVEVLQAYINQVGIRLNLTTSGTISARADGTGSYTGDVFFSVECVNNNDSTYTITVTPDESFNTKVKINPDWWMEYVRINNNNSVVKENISDVSIDENGALTFTFTNPV